MTLDRFVLYYAHQLSFVLLIACAFAKIANSLVPIFPILTAVSSVLPKNKEPDAVIPPVTVIPVSDVFGY